MEITDEARLQIEKWSNEGMRVLVFGCNADSMTLRDATGESSLPHLTLIGILCFSDELRPHLDATLAAFARTAYRSKSSRAITRRPWRH